MDELDRPVGGQTQPTGVAIFLYSYAGLCGNERLVRLGLDCQAEWRCLDGDV